MHPQERPYLAQKAMQVSAYLAHQITSINSVTFAILDFLPYFKTNMGKTWGNRLWDLTWGSSEFNPKVRDYSQKFR